jgi:uncharacterized protein YndB with AHSA1/START domain
MIIVEASAVIDRGIDEVFEFVSDPTNDPRWHTDILEVRMPTPADLRAGTVFTVTVRFMGRRTQTVEVTDMQPGRLIEYTTKDGTIRPVATCLMEPVEGGTRFTRHVELPQQGLLRVMGPVIRGAAQKRQARFVQNLKRLLES